MIYMARPQIDLNDDRFHEQLTAHKHLPSHYQGKAGGGPGGSAQGLLIALYTALVSRLGRRNL